MNAAVSPSARGDDGQHTINAAKTATINASKPPTAFEI
jgi:hypothetical protein